jgi:hypothetical protein
LSISKTRPKSPASKPAPADSSPVEASFVDVVRLIEQARQRVCQAANTELVRLYREIGRYISVELESSAWGGRC